MKKSALAKKKILQADFDRWKVSHAFSCDANYSGSSGAMEVPGAVILWKRSLQHDMRYMNFIGDGDSSAFLTVMVIDAGKGPYREKRVSTEECVNPFSKRFGTALRSLVKQTVVHVGEEGKKKSVTWGVVID